MADREKVLGMLKDRGEMTTSEIEQEIYKMGMDCPDGAAKTLMRLKTQGVIKGRMNPGKKGWVWSLP